MGLPGLKGLPGEHGDRGDSVTIADGWRFKASDIFRTYLKRG
jgi:hypothetical protein